MVCSELLVQSHCLLYNLQSILCVPKHTHAVRNITERICESTIKCARIILSELSKQFFRFPANFRSLFSTAQGNQTPAIFIESLREPDIVYSRTICRKLSIQLYSL